MGTHKMWEIHSIILVSLQTSEYSFSNKGHEGEDWTWSHKRPYGKWAQKNRGYVGSPQGSILGQASRPRPQQEMWVCRPQQGRWVAWLYQTLIVSIPDCMLLPRGITPCCQMHKHRQSCCKMIAFLDQILTLLKISLKTCLIMRIKVVTEPKRKKEYIITSLETRPISCCKALAENF